MEWSFFIKGIISITVGLLFFKYFNKPLWSKEDTKIAREGKIDELSLFNIRFDSKVIDIRGFIGGIGLIIVGIACLYLAFKKN